MNEELQSKIEFVQDLNKAIVGKVRGIEKVKYVVCVNKDKGFVDEFLVVRYKGGYEQVRNCNWNSHLAILQELAIMCESSQTYHDEESLNVRLCDDKWNIYE